MSTRNLSYCLTLTAYAYADTHTHTVSVFLNSNTHTHTPNTQTLGPFSKCLSVLLILPLFLPSLSLTQIPSIQPILSVHLYLPHLSIVKAPAESLFPNQFTIRDMEGSR